MPSERSLEPHPRHRGKCRACGSNARAAPVDAARTGDAPPPYPLPWPTPPAVLRAGSQMRPPSFPDLSPPVLIARELRSEDLREPLETGLPPDGKRDAHFAGREAHVPESEAGSSVQLFDDVGHNRRRARWRVPRVHELGWTLQFKKLALLHVGLSASDAGRTPPATDAKVTSPLSRVEHARTNPPLSNVCRRECVKHLLGRRHHFHSRQDPPLNHIRDRSRSVVSDAGHTLQLVSARSRALKLHQPPPPV